MRLLTKQEDVENRSSHYGREIHSPLVYNSIIDIISLFFLNFIEYNIIYRGPPRVPSRLLLRNAGLFVLSIGMKLMLL